MPTAEQPEKPTMRVCPHDELTATDLDPATMA
jgi:hypothetical protein